MTVRELLLFSTTQAALQAEEVLLEGEVAVEVVPKPPGFEGLCGIALELPVQQVEKAAGLLAAQGISFQLYREG